MAIADHFGDDAISCVDSGHRKFAVCASEPAPGDSLLARAVPDPEELFDVPRILLQAIVWSARFKKGSYGKVGLLAAVQGQEHLGEGRPLGAGLMSCPQFGALRHVRAARRRLDEAVVELVAGGLIEERRASRDDRDYATLVPTDRGFAALGIIDV